MTQLTPDRLAEIVARDARDEGFIGKTGQYQDWITAIEDRRALLSHVSTLQQMYEGARLCDEQHLAEAAERINALTAEIAALRRDAERYRWLRTAGAWESEIGMDELSKDPAKFDAAIDSAMSSASKAKQEPQDINPAHSQ